MKAAILGASGAIGSAILNSIKKKPNYNLYYPSSKDLDFREEIKFKNFDIEGFDLIFLSLGSYSGLKGYELSTNKNYNDIFYDNQINFCEKLSKKDSLIINISSASLENERNFQEKSPYFSYTSEKRYVEEALSSLNRNVISIRPTNIISCYENLNKSGHVFASMHRKIMESKNSCEIWTSPRDWREFTSCAMIEDLIHNLIVNHENKTLPEGFNILPIGNGRKTKIVDLADMIKESQNKDEIKILANQDYKEGPLKYTIGMKQVNKFFGTVHFLEEEVVDMVARIYK